MAARQVDFGPSQALRAPPSVLQIQAFPQIVVVDGSLRHDGSLLVQIGAPSRDELGRLRESVRVYSVEAAPVARQTLVIVEQSQTIGIRVEHHLVLEHESLAALAIPRDRLALLVVRTAWGHADGERRRRQRVLVSRRVGCRRVVLNLVDLRGQQRSLLLVG